MRILLQTLILAALPGLLQAQLRLSAGVFGAAIIEAGHPSVRLTGTIGQVFVGSTNTSTSTVEAGFWFVDGPPQATSIEPPEAAEIPTEVRLEPNYPNPFNPQTTIGYALPEAVRVSLVIFDSQGREVARLVDNRQQAGRHTITFDARHLPSGPYFTRLVAGEVLKTGSMLLLK